jgi:DNA-binding MurR/RpiR family transcriptional regulator
VDHLAADEPHSVLAFIRSQLETLPPREAGVARAILEQPYEALTWSAQEIGAHAATSSATAIRACHRLGFNGLPALRIALARELGWSRLSDATESNAPDASLEIMLQTTAKALLTFGERFDRDSLGHAVEAIATARRVVFVCAGPTQIVCQDAVFDLLTIGRPAEFAADPIVQYLTASRLGAHDVCFAVGVSGANELTIKAANAASAAKATVIALTGFARSELAELADIRLTVSSQDMPVATHAMACIITMLVVVRALASGVRERIGGVDGAGDPPGIDMLSAAYARRSHRQPRPKDR